MLKPKLQDTKMEGCGRQEGALINGIPAPSREPREHMWTFLQLGYIYKYIPVKEESHQTVADPGPGRPVSFHCVSVTGCIVF